MFLDLAYQGDSITRLPVLVVHTHCQALMQSPGWMEAVYTLHVGYCSLDRSADLQFLVYYTHVNRQL